MKFSLSLYLVHCAGFGPADWDLLPHFSHLTSQRILKLFTDSEVDEKVSAGIHHDEELVKCVEDEEPFRPTFMISKLWKLFLKQIISAAGCHHYYILDGLQFVIS